MPRNELCAGYELQAECDGSMMHSNCHGRSAENKQQHMTFSLSFALGMIYAIQSMNIKLSPGCVRL